MMDSSSPNLRPRLPIPTSQFLRLDINPSIGPVRCMTTRKVGKRPRTIIQSARDRELEHARELYRQEQLSDHEKRSEQSIPSSEYSTALDIKECVLQVQKLYLRDLAAEENHVKGFTSIHDVKTIDLEKSHKEVDRVINALHLRERKA